MFETIITVAIILALPMAGWWLGFDHGTTAVYLTHPEINPGETEEEQIEEYTNCLKNLVKYYKGKILKKASH